MGKIRLVIEGEFDDDVEFDDPNSYDALMENLIGFDIISEKEV